MHGLLDALTSAATRAAITGAVAGVAALIGLGGVVALFVALYLALAERFSPAEAAFLTAVAAFAVCGLTLLVLRFRSSGRRSAATPAAGNPSGSEAMESTLASAMQLGSSFSDLVHRNRREAAVSAFVVGIVCGASPSMRRRIADLAKAIVRREKQEDDKS